MSERIRVSSHWDDKEEEIRRRLRSYRALVSKYDACVALFDTLYPRSTARITDDPHSGGSDESDLCELESIVQQRMDMSERMSASLQDMRHEIGGIMKLLQGLPPDEYTILLRRYTMAESMEEISQTMHISTRHCWRLHVKAIWRIVKRVSDLQ